MCVSSRQESQHVGWWLRLRWQQSKRRQWKDLTCFSHDTTEKECWYQAVRVRGRDANCWSGEVWGDMNGEPHREYSFGLTSCIWDADRHLRGGGWQTSANQDSEDRFGEKSAVMQNFLGTPKQKQAAFLYSLWILNVFLNTIHLSVVAFIIADYNCLLACLFLHWTVNFLEVNTCLFVCFSFSSCVQSASSLLGSW